MCVCVCVCVCVCECVCMHALHSETAGCVCLFLHVWFVCVHACSQDVYMHVSLWYAFTTADQAYNRAFSILQYPSSLADRQTLRHIIRPSASCNTQFHLQADRQTLRHIIRPSASCNTQFHLQTDRQTLRHIIRPSASCNTQFHLQTDRQRS